MTACGHLSLLATANVSAGLSNSKYPTPRVDRQLGRFDGNLVTLMSACVPAIGGQKRSGPDSTSEPAMGAGTVISPERARSQFEGAADFGALRCWGRSLPKMARLNSRTFMTILWPGFRKHPGRFMFTSCRVRNHPLAWANQACHRLRRCFATPSSLVPANGFATYLYRNTNWPNHLPGSQGRDSVPTARLSRRQQTRV